MLCCFGEIAFAIFLPREWLDNDVAGVWLNNMLRKGAKNLGTPMQASSNHLRLYAIENIREADRSTAKKVNLSQPIAFAGVFASSRGPGIACLSPTGILHVCPSKKFDSALNLLHKISADGCYRSTSLCKEQFPCSCISGYAAIAYLHLMAPKICCDPQV